jgi:RNA polymerase sigma factor (sigma-70 family)
VTPAAAANDEKLAALAAAGDVAAFEMLVSRHQARVYRLAWRLTQSEADAQDVLQETFLAAYRGLQSFRGASRFSTWLYRVAMNAALMHRRQQSRRRTEPVPSTIRPIRSRRPPQVLVMETTNARDLHHPAVPPPLHIPMLGCILREG